MAKVISVNAIEIATGVSEKDFESFIMNKSIQLYEQIPGQTVHLMKGDRGERAGKYLIRLEFDSQQIRDQIYPRECVGSAELMRILNAAGTFRGELEAMIASRSYTGYLQFDRQ